MIRLTLSSSEKQRREGLRSLARAPPDTLSMTGEAGISTLDECKAQIFEQLVRSLLVLVSHLGRVGTRGIDFSNGRLKIELEGWNP